MIPSAYTQDLIHQRDRAIAERNTSETECGRLRRHVAELTEQLGFTRETLRLWVELWTRDSAQLRYATAAWQSTIVEARRQAARAEQAEARIAAVRALHRPITHHSVLEHCPHDQSHDQACIVCGDCAPCPTIAALDGATTAAEARP
ncbi:hypothetical protein [Kitasatospora sp. A2-31]|uniref:hypothetical protein n=1 Tax=Kitasatospora sp. A2-31 TaxID=2916414 RepID=UPI001EE8F31E|nr:hypothetical protein [Kitasatospora sp. A2-31]MCG6493411.1 hypothetical protein [Kitasatospora sp. A2-31]